MFVACCSKKLSEVFLWCCSSRKPKEFPWNSFLNSLLGRPLGLQLTVESTSRESGRKGGSGHMWPLGSNQGIVDLVLMQEHTPYDLPMFTTASNLTLSKQNGVWPCKCQIPLGFTMLFGPKQSQELMALMDQGLGFVDLWQLLGFEGLALQLVVHQTVFPAEVCSELPLGW